MLIERKHVMALGALVVIGATLLMTACSRTALESPARHGKLELPRIDDITPREYPGLHNAVAFHPGVISGSMPEGAAGFQSLQALGVKTVISVDGAAPDVVAARLHGLRYIHLPIGYNGFDEPRRLQLTRATRDALRDGPVYIHCHHGKHRSAAAAGTALVSLNLMTADQGVARMKVSGTSSSYRGLYARVGEAAPLDKKTIDAVSADFPERWQPKGFVKSMVEIAHVMDNLRDIEEVGWHTPADHPDLIPAAEAGRMVDLLRFAAADKATMQRYPAKFADMLTKSQRAAKSLEDALAESSRAGNELNTRFERLSASCIDCHKAYRD